MRKVLFLMPALYLIGVSTAYGRLSDFRPRLYSYAGQLETDYKYSLDKKTLTVREGGARSSKSTSHKLRESLHLQTFGYAYHPNLFEFSIAGSGMLQQERRQTSSSDSSISKNLVSQGYSLIGKVLQYKRYNALLYTSKKLPFLEISNEVADQKVITSSGVEVHYDDLPWRFNFYYTNDLTESETQTDIQDIIYNTSLLYFNRRLTPQIDQFRCSTGLKHDISEGKTGKITSDHSYFAQSMRYKKNIRNALGGSLSTVATDFMDRKTTKMSESLQVNLPWNFDLTGRYNYLKSDLDRKDAGVDDYWLINDDVEFALNQQLFNSLQSALSAAYENKNSSQGNSKVERYSLGTSYRKNLRGGGVNARFSNGISRIFQKGKIIIQDEYHTIDAGNLTFTFDLDRLEADYQSVTLEVEVEDDNANKRWEILEDDEWSFDRQANPVTVKIDKTALCDKLSDAKGVSECPLPPYEFKVNYSTTYLDYAVQTNSTRAGIGISLWDELFSTVFFHNYTVHDLIEGESLLYDISPSVTEDRVEVNIKNEPFAFSAHYRIVNSDYDINSWGYSALYSKTVRPFAPLESGLSAFYSKSGSETESNGVTTNSKSYSYSMEVDSSLLVPKTSLIFLNASGYQRQVDNEPKFEQTILGPYARITEVEEDEDFFYTHFSAKWKVKVPRTKWFVKFKGIYDYDKHSSGEEESIFKSIVSTDHKWVFGATVLKFSSKYEWEKTDKTSDTGSSSQSENDSFDLTLKLTRRLF